MFKSNTCTITIYTRPSGVYVIKDVPTADYHTLVRQMSRLQTGWIRPKRFKIVLKGKTVFNQRVKDIIPFIAVDGLSEVYIQKGLRNRK